MGGKDIQEVPKPLLTFYQAVKTFVSYLLNHQNFLSQILISTKYKK